MISPDFTRNSIIWGDSLEILPGMKDKSVDLILTDPPYDLKQPIKVWLQDQFIRVCKGAIIVFSPPENQWINPADQFGFWVKPTSTKNTSRSYSRFVEMIFFYQTLLGPWNVGRHWSQYTNVFFDIVDDTSTHPYRKPPSLIERLIRNHSKPGALVFDPFGGSMVVPEVCKRTGRDYLAIEKDPLLLGFEKRINPGEQQGAVL